MSADIPTQADFLLNPQKNLDLDGWHAWETFGGRTVDEAYAIFRENALHYQADLMWMAPKPFCFYLPIALRYLQSEESTADSDIVNCLASDIMFHVESGHDISPAFPCIQEICNQIISCYAKYDVPEEVYGDLRPMYEQLRQSLDEINNAPNSGPMTSISAPGVEENYPPVS